MRLLYWFARRVLRRTFRSEIAGRERDPDRPGAGRFTRADVDAILVDAWGELARLRAKARLDRYPRVGTRLNAYLSLATLAVFRGMRRWGVDRDRAIALTADAGWGVYRDMIRVPRFLARLFRRAPRQRMSFIIRSLIRFPFAPPKEPDAPGYRLEAWEDEGGMHTHWTRCPPLEVFREQCDDDELDAFRYSWCRFDFPAAEAMARNGRFIRPHVLSEGDSVCDMTWTTTSTTS